MSCNCNQLESSTEQTALLQTFPEIDCFKMTKLYDWVKLKTEQQLAATIPIEDQTAVQDAVLAGHVLTITGLVDLSTMDVEVALIDRKDDYCACVQFRKSFTINVTIYDDTDQITLSKFSQLEQVYDSAKLCYPVGMSADAIKVKVTAADAGLLSAAPLNGVVTFLFSACEDIQVVLDILAKVEIKGFCVSREGANCVGSVPCTFGSATYPKQCQTPCA